MILYWILVCSAERSNYFCGGGSDGKTMGGDAMNCMECHVLLNEIRAMGGMFHNLHCPSGRMDDTTTMPSHKETRRCF